MGSEHGRVHAPGTAGGNPPPHNSRIASALKTAWPGLAILGYFGIAIAFCNPMHDTALYDDWAYADNVRRFVERGELRFVWTQVPFFGQLLGGALFAVLFGFSFASLHLFGLTMGIMGAFAVYALVRECGRSRSTSLLLALAVASTTAYFHFCFTFMTDVPATASFLVFLAVFARAERAAARAEPHTVRLFLIAGIILAISATIRDFTLFFLVPPVLAWAMSRQRHTRLAAVASTVALSMISYGIMHVFVDMPLRKAKLAPVFFQPESLRQAYVMTSYLGLALVPLVLALVPDFVRREIRGSWRRWLLWGGCLVLMVTLAWYQYGWSVANIPEENNELMPYRPGFISIFGIYNRLTIPGTPVVIMPPAVRYALTGLAILGASVLLYAGMVLLQVLVARGRREARLRGVTAWCAAATGALGLLLWGLGPRLIHDSTAIMGSPRVIGEALVLLCALSALVFAAMLRRPHASPPSIREVAYPVLTAGGAAVTVAAFLYYLVSAKFFARYTLAMVPGALLVMLVVFRRLRFSRPILLLGIVVYTTLSIAWTRERISFNEARWDAGRWLLQQGVPSDEIVAGFEFDCWHNEFRGPKPSPHHSFVGDVWLKPHYILALDNFRDSYPRVPGVGKGVRYWGCEYRRIRPPYAPTFLYMSIFEGREREIEIWRRVDIPMPGKRR